jgi:NAD(P)-dependent dehydrogenase (short-subunit alcohol dehydrogenase family)
MTFENKVAVVTGGGVNIGRHIAERFANGGAKVAIVDYSFFEEM